MSIFGGKDGRGPGGDPSWLGGTDRDGSGGTSWSSDFGAEEWTRGAYATSYDLGGLHRWGPFQNDPVGPIHFASSDIAAEGYQHVDGAVRIGTATAERILGEKS